MASPLTPARVRRPPPPAAAAPPAAVALPWRAAATTRRVVLAMHGSFNPVHRGHIAAMEAAKAALEAQGYVVPYGELAITKQSHVTGKGVPCLGIDSASSRLLRGDAVASRRDGSQATTGTKHVAGGAPPPGRRGRRLHRGLLDGGDVCLRWPKPNKPPAKLSTGASGAQRNALRFVVLRRRRRRGARAAPYHAVLLPPPADGALAAASSTAARAALDRRDHAELAAICGDAVAAALRERLQVRGTVVQGSFSSATLYHAGAARVFSLAQARAGGARGAGALRGVASEEWPRQVPQRARRLQPEARDGDGHPRRGVQSLPGPPERRVHARRAGRRCGGGAALAGGGARARRLGRARARRAAALLAAAAGAGCDQALERRGA